MKLTYFYNIIGFLCSLSIFPALSMQSHAENKIEFNGVTYNLSESTVLLDAEGIYEHDDACKDPKEAFDRINNIGPDAILLVAPSVYWLDDPDDPDVRTDRGGTPYAVRINCEHLKIIGLSDNPEDIVFAVNRGQTQGAVGNFTMFHFTGSSLEIGNITFGNYCNIDLVYPRNTELNRDKRKDAIVQAQIGICQNTDRLYAENCRFISRLNLCPFIGARRSLYDNCYFECTDDALSGSAVYLDCKFKFFSSKPFYSTAETGAVFLNCDIECLGSGVQYFTKVPGKITVINTRFHSKDPIEIKWTRDASDIICRQMNNTLNGIPYIIDSDRLDLGPELSDSSIKDAYLIEDNDRIVYNLPNLLSGDDGWDPKGINSLVKQLEPKYGRKLTGIPVSLRIKSDKTTLKAVNDTARILSTPLLWGSYEADGPSITTYVSENTSPEEKEMAIRISTQEGLTGQKTLKISPSLRNAPRLKHSPKIVYDSSSGNLKMKYTLSGKGTDDSSIMWGRICRDENGSRVTILKKGDADNGNQYSPKAGDLGYEIIGMIFPKYKDSVYGMIEISEPFAISDPSYVADLPESSLYTDFSDVPIEKREPGDIGVWSFDIFKPVDTASVEWQPADGAGWYYGTGFDSSVGKGIVQNEKGARMSYIPARDICRNMKVSLIAEPAKSGGQGFGSATSQYMDICVKFDPVGLNGYALRIERTSDHDKAVSFSLIKYNNGETAVLSQKIISNCFRTPCHITIDITDGILSATAFTDAPEAKKCCEKVVEKVMLQTPVEESLLTGFCIQHTGSVGPSSTLIRDLNIIWE